jgi:hypothetical protein
MKASAILLLAFLTIFGLTASGQGFSNCQATVTNNKFVFTFEFEGEALHFQIMRISGFNPCEGETPQNHGSGTIVATTSNWTFVDNSYINLPNGFYAYAVRAKLPNQEYTQWCYSNIVFKGSYDLTLQIELGQPYYVNKTVTFTSTDVCGAELSIIRSLGPYYEDETEFAHLMPGTYSLLVEYEDYFVDYFDPAIEISSDTTIVIVAQVGMLPIESISVDTVNLVAGWEAPSDLVLSYLVYLDGVQIAAPTEPGLQLPCIDISTTQHQLSVVAVYPWGNSEPSVTHFRSGFLPAPSGFSCAMTYVGNNHLISWNTPLRCDGLDAYGITHYEVLVNGQPGITVPSGQLNVVLDALPTGVHNIGIKAQYDLSAFGLTGSGSSGTGEEFVLEVAEGHYLPNEENWQSGTFSTQGWQADEPHWAIVNESRSAESYARMKPVPDQNGQYQFGLTSSLYQTKYKSFLPLVLEYDLKLNTIGTSGTERLMAMILFIDNTFVVLEQIQNAAAFDWQTRKFDISTHSNGKNIRISFAARGQQSAEINGWYVDNIRIYEDCRRPEALMALQEGNNIKLTWEMDHSGIQTLLSGFTVFRRTGTSGEFEQIGTVAYNGNSGSEFSFADSQGLADGIEYSYKVMANYTNGLESAESEAAPSFENPAQDWVSVQFVGIVSIENAGFKLQPNPSGNFITVSAPGALQRVVVTDLHGRQLLDLWPLTLVHHETIDIRHLPGGIYFVTLHTLRQKRSLKLVVE